MSMDLGAGAATAPSFAPGLPAAEAPFDVISAGPFGLEVRSRDGAIFAFMLNPAHTGLVDCRRPDEGADHENHRAAARRFAENYANEAGLIFCPKVA